MSLFSDCGYYLPLIIINRSELRTKSPSPSKACKWSFNLLCSPPVLKTTELLEEVPNPLYSKQAKFSQPISEVNNQMKTKRGKKLHTTKKGLRRNRTRADGCFQIQQIIGRGLQDDDDYVPSTTHRRTLSSSMLNPVSHIYTYFTHLIISNRSQRHPQLTNSSRKRTNYLSYVLPVHRTHQLLLCLATVLPLVLADQNVTVDDQDPSILYSPQGAWTLSANNSLDFGGAHMLTQNPNATAVFKFTGIAIYYLSPLWPYTVNTAVSLDSGNVTLVDLVDHSRPDAGQGPETVQSSVVWSAIGLANEPHVLTISVGSGQPFGIVDALIYTNTNPATSSSLPQSSTTDRVIASSTSTTNLNSGSKHILPVALGTVFGILGLLLLMIAIWFFFKNRREKRPISEWTVDGTAYSGAGVDGGRNGRLVNPTPSHPQGKGGWDLSQTYYGGGWYNNGNGNGYPMEQNQQGAWQNSRYANVGMPAPSIPVQDMGRAPNRYTPGNTLSTITEKSTPKMVDGGLRTPVGVGAHSPASVQTTGSNLPETEEYSSNVPVSRERTAGASSPAAANSYPSPGNGVSGHGVTGRPDHRHGGSTPMQHYSKPTGNWL